MVTGSTPDDIISVVFAPTKADYNKLQALLHIHQKATMLFFDCLPDLLGFQAMDKTKHFKIACGFPKLERVFDTSDLTCLLTVVGKSESASTRNADDSAEINVETLWERNDVVPSIPVDLNFAKTESLVELFEYYIRCGNKQVEEFESNNENVGKEPPIAKNFIFVAADGDPIKSAFSIMENDTAGKFDWLVLLIGLFHSFMEVF